MSVKKYVFASAVLALALAMGHPAQAQIAERYGEATTIYFALYDPAGVDLETAATCVTGDVMYSEDGATFANADSCFAQVATTSGMYSLALLSTEMEGAIVMVKIVDQTATKVWMDQTIIIPTHNDESAKYATPLDAENYLADIRTIIKGVVDDTPHTPTTTSFEADALSNNDGVVSIPTAADHFNGRIIVFTSGTLLGQATRIEDYDDDTGNAEFLVTALTSAPSNNDEFVILPHFEKPKPNTQYWVLVLALVLALLAVGLYVAYFRRDTP